MNTTLHSLAVNGAKLHWAEAGQGDPLIFIPGSNGDYRSWQQQVPAFAEHFRTITISRRYEYPDHFIPTGSSTIEDNCTDLLTLFDHLEIRRAHLVAHSFGGYIALAFAEKYPHLVQKLILEEPTVFPFLIKDFSHPSKLILLLVKDFWTGLSFLRTGLVGIKPTQRHLAAGRNEQAMHSFLNGIVGRPVNFKELNPILLQGLTDNIATFALESRTAFNYPLTREQLNKVNCNTLLLHSNQSPRWFTYICRQLAQTLPNCKLIQLTAHTHWLHLDCPNEFNQQVMKFLTQP